ncbi:MAG: cytochrome c [Vicingaceae bacterium]|nr:MAG: cytochrome c [Vicingaceae bacterium]
MKRSFYIGSLIVLIACKSEPNSPGFEYMPDMYRSPAVEAYVDYGQIKDRPREELMNTPSARKPVKGTIPRGFMPYPYPNTDEGYELAGQNLVNPLVINDKNLAEGKELFRIFCSHCHGIKGDGKGSIQHPAYGAVPAFTDTVKNRRNGRSMMELKAGHIYHVITYGLNAMGPHASQILPEERWKIIMYIQAEIQGKKNMMLANSGENIVTENNK